MDSEARQVYVRATPEQIDQLLAESEPGAVSLVSRERASGAFRPLDTPLSAEDVKTDLEIAAVVIKIAKSLGVADLIKRIAKKSPVEVRTKKGKISVTDDSDESDIEAQLTA